MKLYLLSLIVVGWYPLLWICLISVSLGAFAEEPLEHDAFTDRALFVENLASNLLNCIGIIVFVLWVAGMLLALIHPLLSLALFVLFFAFVPIATDA